VAGPGPASKVREGNFSKIWQSSLTTASLTVRGMKYTSQQCCGKIMDNKPALCRESCFLNCKKSWLIKLLAQVLGKRLLPHWIHPGLLCGIKKVGQSLLINSRKFSEAKTKKTE